MAIHGVRRMSPEVLENVLKHLPEPNRVEVALRGCFDYSDVSRQAEEIMDGLNLGSYGTIFYLEGPSKQKVINLYTKFAKSREAKLAAAERRIDLHRAEWDLEDGVQIELSPGEVNVKYRGQGLTYISQILQELNGTDVRISIKKIR